MILRILKLAGMSLLVINSSCSPKDEPLDSRTSTPDAIAAEYLRAVHEQDKNAIRRLCHFGPETTADDQQVRVNIHLTFKQWGLKSVKVMPLDENDELETSLVQDGAKYAYEPKPTAKLKFELGAIPPFVGKEPPFIGLKGGRYYLSGLQKVEPRELPQLLAQAENLAKAEAVAVANADQLEREKIWKKGARLLPEIDLHPEADLKRALHANPKAAVVLLRLDVTTPFMPKLKRVMTESTAYRQGPENWAKPLSTFIASAPASTDGKVRENLDPEKLHRAIELTKHLLAVTKDIEKAGQVIIAAKASGEFEKRGNWKQFSQYEEAGRLGGEAGPPGMLPVAYIVVLQDRLNLLALRAKRGETSDDDAQWLNRLIELVSGKGGLGLGYQGQTDEERMDPFYSEKFFLADYLSATARRLKDRNIP